jgi:radical SAM protein with 4Fe4S-binding SPASM domain
MPFTNLYFAYDGQATMCCRDYNAEITAGDIMSQSILEIWNGPQAEKVRQQHLQPDTLEINACKNCFGLHDFVSPITNHFIHFTRIKMRGLSDDEFAEAVIALWEGMDDAMETRDLIGLKAFVSKAFDAVSSRQPLRPKKAYSKLSLTPNG